MKKLVTLLFKQLQRRRDDAATGISHEGVIKDVYQEVEITPGYFLMLSLANLIALTGLIVNSAPVIIGAMLISPLMGPILSTGFAFATGNRTIWRRALRKVSISVALTLAVAAAASYLSPLQELTSEIAARTRPNLFDLLIAIFAGLAGAIAICTKKNYITIVPGVAIATAVIPPLSVAGFGLGTGSFMVMAGGFFLFFTNFVAIIISTCGVLYFFGFSPAADSGLDSSSVRKRMAFLAAVLCVISVPLVYTLHRSVSELGRKKTVMNALKSRFDRPGVSRLANFSLREQTGKPLEINAVINTIRYLSEREIGLAEQGIRASFGQPVALNLEQIRVQPGGLKEEPPVKPLLAPATVKQRLPVEIMTDARRDLLPLLKTATDRISGVIAPATVTGFTIGFSSHGIGPSLVLRISRDYPFSVDEVRFLEKLASSELGVPVTLRVETVPFIPPLLFSGGEVRISPEMGRSLMAANAVFERAPGMTVAVTSRPDYPANRGRNLPAARQRAESVALFLNENAKIPRERIRVVTTQAVRGAGPTVTVRILPPDFLPQKPPSVR